MLIEGEHTHTHKHTHINTHTHTYRARTVEPGDRVWTSNGNIAPLGSPFIELDQATSAVFRPHIGEAMGQLPNHITNVLHELPMNVQPVSDDIGPDRSRGRHWDALSFPETLLR